MSDRRELEKIEMEVALLMRRAEATRRAGDQVPHRALDRAAYLLLRRLAEHGPAQISALAEALGLDGSTVTRQVSALERDGLVERSRGPQDGRVILVSPTPAGLARVESVRTARVALYEQILADWDDADRKDLARLLTRLNQDMDAVIRSR
ncbi:MAG: MarR family transcriptional regulator [Hamadaea sp.]|uniref:MarR family winged helix-turn-helix transcriptional regulator n=1 Tax=Hamadaea sp. TaxID=2024425 RepID=UPI0017FDEB29|nr:MarR family transcriptional regulator [Hamadaea sp.]NUR71868.1 MarR family transcriptional regulator [Hamadaea sp.]NUT19888.1 MarR family transcriptional regulator [Hamadaea sp.]